MDSNKQIVSVALIVVFLNLALGGAFLVDKEVAEELVIEIDFPEDIEFSQPPLRSASVLAALAPTEEEPINHPLLQGASLHSLSLPGALARKDIVIYEVLLGDTPGSIAARFGVSTNSVLWSNGLGGGDNIFPGQELVIPPVTGIIHKVAKNETISSIASKYRAYTSDIVSFNSLETSEISIGQTLVVPDGKLQPPRRVVKRQKLPTLNGYFINPTIGSITQGIHPRNAVDIGNKCNSTPIYAAAAGKITLAKSFGWNGGAGKYIKIKHDNGTYTLYAHLNSLDVRKDDNVVQGEVIGKMGNTGRVRGPTGCHLHFGVLGAKNPLAP
jgi:murein DD-endopeptidase MepM/ murein hydrolase activator NlpD